VTRPMIANFSDPAFREMAKFLNIPENTIEYRLEFVTGEIVTVEAKYEVTVPSEDAS
jgi:hypothetical protein